MNAEAIVLRTWPIREADQIVALFTREFGKVKGVAKSAAKSRRRFGGALEPMTHVKASFVEKPRQELVRLDYFEIVDPATLDAVGKITGDTLVAVAAFVGATRLIDNLPLPADPSRTMQ